MILKINSSVQNPLQKSFINRGIEIVLILISTLLFTLSFPNMIYSRGFFPVAYICYIPVFLAIRRTKWPFVFLYGAIFGYLSYFLFNFWLMKFHPLAIFVVPVIYSVYFLLFFPILKCLDKFFPKYGYLLQALAWVVFEFLRTKGFLGYSYGVIGYSQYPFQLLIKIADITGIWGLVFLVVFPSSYLARLLSGGVKRFKSSFFKNIKGAVAYGVLLVIVLIYGFISQVDTRGGDTWRVGLVQQNGNPWKDGYIAYERVLDSLIELSNQVLKEAPDVVIWSETSFVPAIEYHYKYREVRDGYKLVKRLLEYLEKQKVPFVIGNDEGVKINAGTRKETRIDYNSALMFVKDEIVGRYRKRHLVPFTEYFPFEKQFPDFHKMLIEADTHFWEKGEEYTIFESGGVKFATPICFEDTFGYLCREFTARGADILVNLTNDSWSESVVAEEQHMTIAIFRAVENNRTMVRCTNGGITCVIDPNGAELARIKPFEKGYLVYDAPIYRGKKTIYTRWGDWFPFAALGIGIIYGLYFLILYIKKKTIDKT